jgi:hypothetical protein
MGGNTMRHISDFDYTVFDRMDVISTKKKTYYNALFAFDIETSTVNDHNYMYIWQFGLKLPGKPAVAYYGRTWVDYCTFMRRLSAAIGDNHIKIFIHNMAYEFQYLRSFVQDLQISNVFLLDNRKPCKFVMLGNLEYYCSYKQTNMSLMALTKKYKVEHVKLPGYDYREVIYPDTPLTSEQLNYCENDVLGLLEALETVNHVYGDSVATMPLTNTGYVRRDVKESASDSMLSMVRAMYPDENVYRLLVQAFRGGNTHASRFFAGDIIDNVHSYDRVSSYPAVQLCHKYPVKRFQPCKPDSRLLQYMIAHDRPVLVRIAFFGIEVYPHVSVPYIALAKVSRARGEIIDNGRILKADYIETTLTDIDYKIIKDTYSIGNEKVLELYVSEYGMLPECFRAVIMDYYRQKTELKGIQGQELYYMKAKNKLNACYGMTATNPVRDKLSYDHDDYQREIPDITKELKIGAMKKPFLSYAWGVWCTAWARYELQVAINLCGDQFVYCDTDSVKYYGDVDFTALNAHLQQLAIDNNAYAVRDAKTYYLGVWEHDGDYKQFRTWGAKKYAYTDDADELHITISGVGKQGAKELQTIDNFKPGFVFRDSAGTRTIFDDDVSYYTYMIDGHTVEHTSNIIIADVTYTVDITDTYIKLLDMLGKMSGNDLEKMRQEMIFLNKKC